MEFKSTPQHTKQVEGRIVTGFASIFGNVDDGNDRTWAGAFKNTLKERTGRVRHLWQHEGNQPPIAAIRDLREVGKADLPDDLKKQYPDVTGALLVQREYLDTPRGSEVLAGILAGAVSEMSFGYDPVRYDFEGDAEKDAQIRNLREVRLWDTSDVNWGMNDATVASKMAVPYRDTGTTDEGASWSKPGLSDMCEGMLEEQSDADKRRIAGHYAYAVNMPPESFGDLKLPHHQPSKTGIGPAVWAGVSAAMARLMQAGTDIPDADRRAVYNHLSKHYAQFEKEPPDFNLIELARIARLAQSLSVQSLKAGRVLSASNLERLKAALATLNEILITAEPDDDGKGHVDPLAAETLKARYRELQRTIQLYNL